MSRWKEIHLAQMQWFLQEVIQKHHVVYVSQPIADRLNVHLEDNKGEMIGYNDTIGNVWYVDIDWYKKYFS